MPITPERLENEANTGLRGHLLRQLALTPEPKEAHPPPRRPSKLGKTEIEYLPANAILTRATGFIASYDFTVNPYTGCGFGCGYCYAAFFTRNDAERDTWGQWVRVKENAASLVRAKLALIRRRSIYCSTVTDPYQPIERKVRLTRAIIQALTPAQPRLVIQTRSPTVVDDVEWLLNLETAGGKAQVNMTVTTDDETVRTAFEEHCPSNPARLKALRQLQQSGLRTCATVTPALPVSDPVQFAEDIAESEPDYVIVQPFHEPGKQAFVAGTRAKALQALKEVLNANHQNIGRKYNEHYRQLRSALKARFGQRLHEGRQGFRPPF